jgi:cytochrome c-type biogenesis protein CcmE
MPYRSDLAALRIREEALVRELEELGDVAERKRRLERDLADLRVAMPGARAGGALRVLRSPPIALPCDVPWDKMQGDERVRFCGQCSKNVYNLSAMTRNEAAELIDREVAPCVRYFQRPDGTVLTTDCPVGVRRRRRRRISSSAAAALIAACAAGATVEGMSHPEPLVATMTVDQLLETRPHGTVRVDGTLVHGSIGHDHGAVRFVLESRGKLIDVRYLHAVVPDTFRDVPSLDLGVMVEGELMSDGTFYAERLLAKAPNQGYMMKSRDRASEEPAD